LLLCPYWLFTFKVFYFFLQVTKLAKTIQVIRILIYNLYHWSLFLTYFGWGYLQIILWGFLICKCKYSCIRGVIRVYIENNSIAMLFHVWSPPPYVHSLVPSIPWNRSNKYKTLLHNPFFVYTYPASYIHIKIIVTIKSFRPLLRFCESNVFGFFLINFNSSLIIRVIYERLRLSELMKC